MSGLPFHSSTGLREIHLFAGAGGGILGGILLGHRTVCAVEIEPYRRKVLLQRQRDGIFPWFPVWDKIETFDATPWKGFVDVVCAGWPCQDISTAGKGKGLEGEKSGLWRYIPRVVRQIGPKAIFLENSPMLTSRGLDRVLKDLARLGYHARWGVFSASSVGGRHLRKRIWILAYSNLQRMEVDGGRNIESEKNVSNSNCAWRLQQEGGKPYFGRWIEHCAWWKSEPNVERVAYGVANGMDRDKAIGNGQVPAVAALAWHTLSQGITL